MPFPSIDGKEISIDLGRILLAAAIFSLLSLRVFAAGPHAGGEFNSTYANIGIKGFEPEAYFTTGKSVRGSDRYTEEHGGVT
jgi:hypothetical protein